MPRIQITDEVLVLGFAAFALAVAGAIYGPDFVRLLGWLLGPA
jgi:hypothetical protein